jgi:hypothetical protein
MASTATPMSTNNTTTVVATTPTVVRDPRFRAGRKLVETGQANHAIDIFATLLAEARRTYGDASIETAPAYYEYGNALFRGVHQQENEGEGEDGDEVEEIDEEEVEEEQQGIDPRQAAALAAERRAKGESTTIGEQAKEKPPVEENEDEKKPAAKVDASEEAVTNGEKGDDGNASADQGDTNEKQGDAGDTNQDGEGNNEEEEEEEEEDDDAQLALEMMETTWSVLDVYVQSSNQTKSSQYQNWASEQIPRVLTGIGDVLSALERHGDAADAYSRALGHRQNAVSAFAANNTSMEFLQARRRVVEANVLIAEELLFCPPDQDVITTESQQLIVSASERVDYARGYYDKARDELQEVVLLMGEIAAQGGDVGKEKEDVCFVATMVMGVGTNLAQLDEEAAEQEPATKKQKK